METTTFARLMQTGCVIGDQNGLTITIPSSWIIKGENRLSYTTLVRLIECCREYHWQTDILPNTKNNVSLDSICKSLYGEFINPILVGSVISITYLVIDIRRKGYSLRFEVRNTKTQTLCAKFDLVSVFYDPVTRKSIAPPTSVFDYLYVRCNQEVNK